MESMLKQYKDINVVYCENDNELYQIAIKEFSNRDYGKLLYENIKNNFWIVAAVFVLAWAYTAFMLSLKQWRDEPKEDPTERIETLLAELFKDEQFCEKID